MDWKAPARGSWLWIRRGSPWAGGQVRHTALHLMSSSTSATYKEVSRLWWAALQSQGWFSYNTPPSSLVFSSGDTLGWLLAHWATPDLLGKSRVCIPLAKPCVFSGSHSSSWAEAKGSRLDLTQEQLHTLPDLLSVSSPLCDLWASSSPPLAWLEDPSSTHCEELGALVAHLDQARLQREIWALPRRGSPGSFPSPQNVGVGRESSWTRKTKGWSSVQGTLKRPVDVNGSAFSSRGDESWGSGQEGRWGAWWGSLPPILWLQDRSHYITPGPVQRLLKCYNDHIFWNKNLKVRVYLRIWMVRIRCSQPDRRNEDWLFLKEYRSQGGSFYLWTWGE